MILIDGAILVEIAKGNIIIDGLNLEYLNPVSVDLTLNPNFKIYEYGVLDCRNPNKTIELVVPEEGYVLVPGEVYLYGSKVDQHRKGGDIDIVWITSNKDYLNLNTKLKLTRDYQKINDERIDILILPPEEKMSQQEKIFYSCIIKQKLFL